MTRPSWVALHGMAHSFIVWLIVSFMLVHTHLVPQDLSPLWKTWWCSAGSFNSNVDALFFFTSLSISLLLKMWSVDYLGIIWDPVSDTPLTLNETVPTPIYWNRICIWIGCPGHGVAKNPTWLNDGTTTTRVLIWTLEFEKLWSLWFP